VSVRPSKKSLDDAPATFELFGHASEHVYGLEFGSQFFRVEPGSREGRADRRQTLGTVHFPANDFAHEFDVTAGIAHRRHDRIDSSACS
jgi:hypothetical protein